MHKRRLLFATFYSRHFDEGLEYAIDLARTMNKDLSILFILGGKGLKKRFSEMMSAVTFAEAGEHETAKAFMAGMDGYAPPVVANDELGRILRKCESAGIDVSIDTSVMGVAAAIKEYHRQFRSIDMVLLGTAATKSRDVSRRNLQNLMRDTRLPVVTITRYSSEPRLAHA